MAVKMTCKECKNSLPRRPLGDKELNCYVWCDYYNKWMYLTSSCNIDTSEEHWSFK